MVDLGVSTTLFDERIQAEHDGWLDVYLEEVEAAAGNAKNDVERAAQTSADRYQSTATGGLSSGSASNKQP